MRAAIEYIKKNKINTALIVFIACMLIPILAGCFYIVPGDGDDYIYPMAWLTYEGDFKLLACFEQVKSYYMRWAGTYFGVFVMSFPVYDAFGFLGVRLVTLAAVVLFLVSVAVLIYTAVCFFGIRGKEKNHASLVLTAGTYFYLLCTVRLNENFYWLTGALQYTLPLALALFTVTCVLRYKMSKKTRYTVTGCITAFCTVGGSLDIAAFLCAVLLFFLLGDFTGYILNRHHIAAGGFGRGTASPDSVFARDGRRALQKANSPADKTVIIAGFALAGALINCPAPGNFARNEGTIGHLDFTGALLGAGFHIVYTLFHDSVRMAQLLVFVAVCFIWGYKFLKDGSFGFKYPAAVTLYAFFAAVITVFPVFLGYGKDISTATVIGDRNAFVERTCIAFFFGLSSAYWGGWVAVKKALAVSREFKLLLVLMLVLHFSGDYAYDMILAVNPLKMAAHMLNGDFSANTARQEYAIKQAESSPDADVVIYISRPGADEWYNTACFFGYGEDGSQLSDQACRYFGKNSIVIRYTDE